MRHPLLALAMLGLCVQATADDGIAVELNKLEAQGEACRAYLVLRNQMDSTLDDLRLDLVLFDGDGVISRRLALDAAPLRAGKTTVKLFDIAGLPCDQIGRILINDTLACRRADGPVTDCIDRIKPTSRSTAALMK